MNCQYRSLIKSALLMVVTILFVAMFVLILNAGNLFAWETGYQNEDCIECHRLSSDKSKLRIDTKAWGTSVHAAGFKCAECHIGVTSDYHISKIGSGAVNCVECHQKRKGHGGLAAGAERPDCVQCHTRHRIYERSNPASSLHVSNLKETCGLCHPEETGQSSYLGRLTSIRIESHNKQDLSQDYSMDNCFGCHQGNAAHGDWGVIEPVSCPDCHMTEDGKNKMLGYMHPKADSKKQPSVFVTAILYQILLFAIIGAGVLYWIRRARKR